MHTPQVVSKLKQGLTQLKRSGERKAKDADGKKITGQKSYNSGIISTFETEDDVRKWSCNGVQVKLTTEYPSEGEYSLKIMYPQGGFPGLSAWRTAPSDWSPFHTLKFDVYNPQERIIKFGILIRDELSDSYPDRYDGYFAFEPGENNFELNITSLKTNDKKRLLRMDRVKELVIFLNEPQKKGELFLDNVKLLQDKALVESQTGLLSNFESKKDFYKWQGHRLRIELAKEHYSEGKQCLKVTFPKREYPGLSASRDTLKDWSKFDSLKFGVYNPHEEVIKFGILIKDEVGDAYPDRYDGYFAFRPGENNFELNITGLKTNNKKRSLELDKIKQLTIFLFRPQKEYTLYFDNFRLYKEQMIALKNFYRFDFGTESSEVWPGFVKVTNKTRYDKKRGYGWSSTYGLKAEDRNYPDSLFRDWVQGPGPFNVDLLNGEYIVYMMLEDPGYWEYYQNYTERGVCAEEKLVLREYLDSNTFFEDYYFKHLNSEDLPGDDVWEKYVNSRFIPKIFTVAVEDGQLNLRFYPSWAYECTLSALIIYPSKNKEQGQAYIKELNSKRKKYFSANFIESIPSEQTLSFALSQQDKKKGYIIFAKNYLERVHPYIRPDEKEITNEISIFTAKGEFEPFTIGIYPLRDLGECELFAEDLVNRNGYRISSENIDIRVTQYKLKLIGKKVFQTRGEFLRNKSRVKIKNGVMRQFWITVKTPENTPAGDYKGEIHFRPLNGEKQIITLKVKVLPLKLDEPNIALGMFYFIPAHFKWYKDTHSILWGRIEKQLWDLKEHNMNSLAIDISPRIIKVSKQGEVELDFRELAEFINIYKHYGFEKPIIGYGMVKLIKQAEKISAGDENRFSVILQNAYKAIKVYVDEIYGPEIVFCLADEISNVDKEGIKYGVKLAQIAREVMGIKTTACLNSQKDEIIFPYLDISTINDGMKISEQLIDKVRNSGSQLWFYNLGGHRFSFGFYLAKTRAQGRLEWNYQLPAVDPYFDLDGRESDYCASYPSMDGPINAVWFEWIREGIDDYRYMLTLSNLIKEAKNSVNPELVKRSREAEDVIASILETVSIKLNDNNWQIAEYDKKRWEVAEQIVKLSKLLKEKQIARE
jgi:hypothetical protein